MSDLGRLEEGLFGMGRIPQISLKIDDLRDGNDIGIDILGMQVLRCAKIGIHGPLAVRGDQHVATCCGRACGGRRRCKRNPGRPDVVREDPAELVVLDLADERGARTQARDTHNGVCCRAARHLYCRTHCVVDSRSLGLINQLHAPLPHVMSDQEVVFRARNHIHNRVADAEDVKTSSRHQIKPPRPKPRALSRPPSSRQSVASQDSLAPVLHPGQPACDGAAQTSEASGMAFKQRVFSGVQPTGNLHLGNYLGAIARFVALQQRYDCIYCIVDLHAITVWQDPAELPKTTREVAAAFIACGIDPNKHIVFNHSQVAEHAELAWVFNCVARLGWLNRMTQFKEKAGKDRENASVGLYAYPALMAADILVYRATHVPVGEDQKQHLELARDVAQKFNNDFAHSIHQHGYGDAFFPLPEPRITGPARLVMSLRDGSKKMSKSDASDYSRINLTDDADAIAQKIRKAKTDPDALPSEEKGLEPRPEADNLVGIRSE